MSNQLYDMYMSQYGGLGDVQAPFTFQVASPGSQPLNYPLSNIENPGINDVMCGRGGATNNHIGNIRFRQLVNEHKLRYLAAPKSDKPKVAGELVQIWRSLMPPGRFLAKSDPDMGDDSLWHDIGDKKARQKCSQSLRERTPDVIPFVQQLQQKQKEEEVKRKLEHEQQVVSSSSGAGGAEDGSGSGSGVVDVVTSSRQEAAANNNNNNHNNDHQPRSGGGGNLTSIPETPISSNLMSGTSAQQQRVATAATTMPTSDRHSIRQHHQHHRHDADDDDDNEFDDDDDIGGSAPTMLSPDAYLEEVDDFLENVPDGDRDAFSVTDQSMAYSTHSWIRSVQSVESGAMMSLGESLREEDDLGGGLAAGPPPLQQQQLHQHHQQQQQQQLHHQQQQLQHHHQQQQQQQLQQQLQQQQHHHQQLLHQQQQHLHHQHPISDMMNHAGASTTNAYIPPQPLIPSAIRPAMPHRSQNATRSQKMSSMMAGGANFSMLSDLTDRSAQQQQQQQQQRSMRSSKMNEASKLTSNFSVRSESTDISAAMRALCADPQQQHQQMSFHHPSAAAMRQQQSLRSALMNESQGNFSKLSMMSGLTDLSEGMNNMDLRKK